MFRFMEIIMSEENQETTPETIQGIHDQFKDTFQQPEQTQVKQPATPQVPDPISDTESFQNYVGQNQVALSQQLNEVSSQLSELKNNSVQEEARKAVSTAVEKINSSVNADPDLVEAYLTKEYNKNPQFQTIWDNRNVNPEAVDKALGVLTKEMQDKLAIKEDGQVAEDQRALDQAMKTSRSTTSPDDDFSKNLMNLDDSKFQSAVNQIKQGHKPNFS